LFQQAKASLLEKWGLEKEKKGKNETRGQIYFLISLKNNSAPLYSTPFIL
jgi:hypothetical protein